MFNDTEIKALIIAIIPLTPGFQSKYALLICMLVLIIKGFKKIKIPPFVIIILVLMAWEAIHLEGTTFSFAEYLSGFAPLMCLAVIVSMPNEKEDLFLFVRVLSITSVVAFTILIISTIQTSGETLFSLIQDGFRFGSVETLEEGHKLIYNANGLGYLCNLSIAGIFINVYFKSAKKIDYLMLAYLIFIGCLTVSRTFLLCFAGTILLYIFMQDKSIIKKIKTLFVITIIIIVAFLLLKTFVPNIIENYIYRFSADDVTGGRTKLFNYYNEFIFSSLERFWYGIGAQQINIKVANLIGVEMNVPHNGYQQIIVAWGMVGLILVLLMIILLVLHAKKFNRKAPFICYLPLVLLLINILAGQFITSGTKLLSLVFIYLMIVSSGNGEENG